MTSEILLEQVLSCVDNDTKKIGNFLSIQNDVAIKFKDTTKRLYDFTKEESKRQNAALPELVIQDFDEEQIWQQLELQNESELTHFLTKVSRVLAGNNSLELPIRLSSKAANEFKDDAANDDMSSSRDGSFDEKTELFDKESNETGIGKRSAIKKKQSRKLTKRPSIVDDKFFKLEELDEYLNKEETRKEETLHHQEDEDSDEDSNKESIDLFDSFTEEEDENDSDDAKMMKYADFFDSPGGSADEIDESKDCENKEEEGAEETEELENSIKMDKINKKRVKFNLQNASDLDSDMSDAPDDWEEKENSIQEKDMTMSSLESRQERLQKRIDEFESAAIGEKPWQLKGEIKGVDRPQNSLLEEYVEFDVTSRPPPIITEQTTLKLEDIIMQRIKDRAWDDVEKKFKPVETPLEYKKKLVMDQEKSKKSLAQIYEDAYVKQREAANNPENETEVEAEEPQEHIKIRKMMQSLFAKLDALSNFHYTPKKVQPEAKIVSNLPAISMEEVAPVATSDATLLAPEEIKSKPRGELIGRTERTSTDMKRERRKKKMKQRAHQKAKEKKEESLVEKLKASGKKYKKSEATAIINKLSKARNVVKVDETNNKVAKSSSAFFAQLQDQVNSHVKSKKSNVAKKRDKTTHSAIKLKL